MVPGQDAGRHARGRRELQVDRRDDARQRADVGEEARDRMVVAGDANPVAVDVELRARHYAFRLDVADVEADAARGGGDLLEQPRHLVHRWNELAQNGEVAAVARALGLDLGEGAALQLTLDL